MSNVMWSDWVDAATQLAAIIDLIANSEFYNKASLNDDTAEARIQVSIRNARSDGPGGPGGYNMRGFIRREHAIYELTLRRRT